MELKVTATAGTLESSDIQIILEPNDDGIEINLESSVYEQFGDQIQDIIMATLNSFGIENALVFANDSGAIDAVIKSRVQTAIFRSSQSSEYKYI